MLIFCCTAEWLSYTYILFHIFVRHPLSQDVGYISLCYTVRPCCLDNCYLNAMGTLYSDIEFPLQAKCSLCISWCWLSLPVCAFPTSAPAHQAPCGLSSPARFPWPGATSLLPDLPERSPLSQHTVRVVVQSSSAPVCILLFHLYSRAGQSHQSPTVLRFLPSRGTLLSYLAADLELEDKSPSWGDPPLGIEKLPDALLFLPQTAIKHQLKQGVRRHFGFSMFLLYSVKMYASWEELM